MEPAAFQAKADADFYVWPVWQEALGLYASDTNLPGLFIEAETLGEFEAVMLDVVPELLAANVFGKDGHTAAKPKSVSVLWGEGAARRRLSFKAF